MGGGRNPHREEQVKGLNVVALAHGKAAIRENSGRPLVRELPGADCGAAGQSLPAVSLL